MNTSGSRLRARHIPAIRAQASEGGLAGANQVPASRAVIDSARSASQIDHRPEFIVFHAKRTANRFDLRLMSARPGFSFLSQRKSLARSLQDAC